MRWVLLEIAKFNARFAKLVQCLHVDVLPLCDVASACDFECCVRYLWGNVHVYLCTCLFCTHAIFQCLSSLNNQHVSSKMWNFSLVLSHIVSGLRFVMTGGILPPPAAHRCTAKKFVIRFPLHNISPSRPERWSIFQGDGMAMVVFLQRWNGDGL